VTDYAIAPDGRSFVVGDGAQLVLQRADGSNRRLLTDAGTIEFDPSFSPDGATIVTGRADPSTGSGLGLWTRSADGGDPRPVQLPVPASPTPSQTPTPAASASPSPAPVPLLRAPRYSPDGTALAFVDQGGRLGILDLTSGSLVAANVLALTPPVWLADSSSLVVSALPSGPGAPTRALVPQQPASPLDSAALPLTDAQLRSLSVVRMWRESGFEITLPLPGGATRPAVDALGRISFVTLDAGHPSTGRLWLSTLGGSSSLEILRGDTGTEETVTFAPEPGTLVVGRGTPAEVGRAVSGVWLVDSFSGTGTQLVADGWLPRWLP
jgi:hypothetical protein